MSFLKLIKRLFDLIQATVLLGLIAVAVLHNTGILNPVTEALGIVGAAAFGGWFMYRAVRGFVSNRRARTGRGSVRRLEARIPDQRAGHQGHTLHRWQQ